MPRQQLNKLTSPWTALLQLSIHKPHSCLNLFLPRVSSHSPARQHQQHSQVQRAVPEATLQPSQTDLQPHAERLATVSDECRQVQLQNVAQQPAHKPAHNEHATSPVKSHQFPAQAAHRHSSLFQRQRPHLVQPACDMSRRASALAHRYYAHQSGPKQKPEDQHLKPVRVVFDDGKHEVMAISDAQRTASRLKKDLLPVAPNARPPVFKLGHKDQQAAAERRRQKEQRKRELEQRRKLAMKEVRVGADTADHDLGVKLRQAQGFIEKNFRVKLVVRFGRWRQTEGGQRMRDLVDRVGVWSTVTAPQANEKLPRNTIAVYLTPKLLPVESSSPLADSGSSAKEASHDRQSMHG